MKTESVALLPLEGSVRRPTSAPLEPHQEGRRLHGVQGHKVEPGDGAAPIVAVKAGAGVEVELGLGPRAEREASLGADDRVAGTAGVLGQRAGDLGGIEIGAHHDLSVATMRVALDHETCMEVAVLKGRTAEVEHFAEHVIAERGVRHGQLFVVPAEIETERHAHGDGRVHAHQHIRVR